MRPAKRLGVLAASIFSMALVTGCEVSAGPVDAGPPDAIAIGPGYYYDEAYVDVGGVHHPREYWYHDDHGWSHRDAPPPGAIVHDRARFGYVHGGAPSGGRGGFDHGAEGGDGGAHGR